MQRSAETPQGHESRAIHKLDGKSTPAKIREMICGDDLPLPSPLPVRQGEGAGAQPQA